ncbi:hypothetical protein ABI59_00105 [Acidobacteria bacterium Mor1]|nr:hypothetical protein ABI59_00105 [Acidobacteria bacterium Mor1]
MDSPSDLAERLPYAPPPYLEGALQNPKMQEDQIGLLLRNPGLTGPLLESLARNGRWTRIYEVKKRLVRHPRTPFQAARNLVHHLLWKDLAETAADSRLHPAIRRQAESMLKTRLDSLALGEKITLARKATPAIVEVLVEGRERPVLEALLGNPALDPGAAEKLAARRGTPPEVLSRMATHSRWALLPAIRLAVAHNPRTPVAVALKLIERMPRAELERLVLQEDAPKIVLVGAQRRLTEAAGGAEAS